MTTPFRAWRDRLDLSQREAATRLDYGKRKVEAWDRGQWQVAAQSVR